MDPHTTTIVEKFLTKLRKQFTVNKAILFGSRARGDNWKTSDFDFVLVSEDFASIPFVSRGGKILEYWEEDLDADFLCYTPAEFERKSQQIGTVQEAVKEGMLV